MNTMTRPKHSHPRKRDREHALGRATSAPGINVPLDKAALPERLAFRPFSFRRRDLDRPSRGAATAVGPIHVLHKALRVDISAGRNGTHHVCNGEHGRVAALAL